MAREFNGSSTYLTVANGSALYLPDGDWTLAGWINTDAIAASGYQYFVSCNPYAATPQFYLYVSEPNAYVVAKVIFDDGTSKQIGWNPGVITAGEWTHVCLRSSSDDMRLYVNGVQSGSANNTACNGCSPAGDLYVGGRSDANPDRFFDGRLAEWAKWDTALSDAQLAKLVLGYSPLEIGATPAWYLPLLSDYAEKIVPLTVTNYDTTQSDHPANIYNAWPQVKVDGSFVHRPVFVKIDGSFVKKSMSVIA